MSFELYDFQVQDIEKIERQKAGAIGSEMGTGKTHEAIALDELWWKRGAGPTLVVAPLNTHDSWVEKYSMQSPASDVIVIDRKNRDRFVTDIRRKRGDVFILHHQALRLLPELTKIQFNTIIADEAHHFANRKSQQTHALKKLHTEHKLAMSGTLSGDKPENLWSVFNWLFPTFYGSYWSFVKHYLITQKDEEKGYQKIVGVQNVESLKKQIDPWFVRHLKKEQCCEQHPEGVMWWLPDKTYDIMWVDLSPTQRRFYEQMRQNLIAWVNEQEDTPLVAQQVVTQLARLNQMALATPYIAGTKWVWRKVNDEKTRVEVDDVRLKLPSSKIDAVKERIQDAGSKQFVVFTSSKQTAYLAEAEFNEAGIASRVLSGDTSQSDRDGMVHRFVNGDYQVFIGVIQAAGEGIDGLQHATDTAFFLDRSWSTIQNQQAEDRLHRGGTKDTVQIIDVMARNTMDWGRKQKLDTKWANIKAILGDGHYTRQAETIQHYRED